jgi:hypothetical protein
VARNLFPLFKIVFTPRPRWFFPSRSFLWHCALTYNTSLSLRSHSVGFISGPRSRSVTCPYPVAVVITFTTSSPRKKPFIDYVPEVTTSRLRSAPRIDYSSLHAPPQETPESQLPSESPATANSRRHTPDDPEPASPTRLVRTMSGHSNPTESRTRKSHAHRAAQSNTRSLRLLPCTKWNSSLAGWTTN